MQPITSETPRTRVKIGGVVLNVPAPFKEGDVLNANEAAALNQTYRENIGNNFRSEVDGLKKKLVIGKDAPSADELKAVSDAQLKDITAKIEAGTININVAALQAGLDKTVVEYKMGVRRTSSVEPMDPVEREAWGLAKDRIKKALVGKGIKLNTVSAEWWEREITKLLAHPERGAAIKQAAERRVKIAQSTAGDELDDLDLSGAEKPKPEAPAPVNATPLGDATGPAGKVPKAKTPA